MATYHVNVETAGNPDRGQSPRLSLGGVRLEAPSMFDLRRKVRSWCDENGIGGGNWTDPAVCRDGEVIGFMSFNGRVWDRPDYRDAKEVAV